MFGRKRIDDEDESSPIFSDEFTGIDVSNGLNTYAYNSDDDYPTDTYDENSPINEEPESQYQSQLNRDMEVTPYSQPNHTVTNVYRQIDSAEDSYNLIAGINDIPEKYRRQDWMPEVIMSSLQFNNFNHFDIAEWQIKTRSLIRKHQMLNPDNRLSGKDIAGLTYINDTLIWRAKNGFERKMCNPNLSGVIEESNSESAPYYGNGSQQKKPKSFLNGLFGGK